MEQNLVHLTYSLDGKPVVYDPEHSHAATHIADTPGLKELAIEVISMTVFDKDYIQIHKDLGRIVGLCDLITNQPGDKIIWAKRLNRTEYSVFNKTQPPQPSSLVTIAVDKQVDESYKLVSTWIGPSDSPSFPGTEHETPDSRQFWSQHSLAWGRQEIQPGTETSVCPW